MRLSKDHWALLIVCALIGGYSLLFTSLAIAQHAAHRTSIFDLGVYDQAIWNTAHGRILAYSPEPEYGDNFLATHLQPILILLAPIYWLWDDVRAPFVAQTLALALGALPVFFLTRWKTQSGLSAVTMSAVYLLLPALEAANLFDFHPETFTPVLCLTLFWLLEQIVGAKHLRGSAPLNHQSSRANASPLRARWAFWLCLGVTLAVKEDAALIVAMIGLYVALLRRRWRLGWSIVAVATIWFLVGVYVVMPHFHRGQLSPFLTYYASLGDNPQSIVWNALTQPSLTASLLFTRENGIALLAFLLPLAFLPLLDLPIFLIALPAILLNGLSENPLMHLMEDKHYAAPIIPFAMLAAIYGLGRLRHRSIVLLRVATLTLIVATLGYHYFRGYTPLSRMFQVPTVSEHDRIAQTIAAQIPPTASLVAQDRLYPHLAHREQMSYLWPERDSADYIFVDVAHSSFVNADNIHAWLKQQIAARTDYGVVASHDGYILLQRGAPHAELSPDFYSFAQVQHPQINHPLRAQFGDELELLGFNYVAPRDQELKIELYWRALKDTMPDRLPNLYLLNADGRSIGETRFPQPTLIWYPTSQWRAGQTVRVLANTLTWSTDELDRYTLALSVLDQPDPRQAKRALPIRLPDGGDTSRVLRNGTLLRLGDFQRQFGLTWLIR